VLVVLRVERVRDEVWRRERGARQRVDLVQEPGEAARAEDVGGRAGEHIWCKRVGVMRGIIVTFQ
jgi:hypothetical protein